jgi:hypothetical protein
MHYSETAVCQPRLNLTGRRDCRPSGIVYYGREDTDPEAHH